MLLCWFSTGFSEDLIDSSDAEQQSVTEQQSDTASDDTVISLLQKL